MISCKFGEVQMDGDQPLIEADVACIIRSYLKLCEEEGWTEKLADIIEIARMSDDEVDQVIAAISKVSAILKAKIEEAMGDARKS